MERAIRDEASRRGIWFSEETYSQIARADREMQSALQEENRRQAQQAREREADRARIAKLEAQNAAREKKERESKRYKCSIM